MSDTLYYEKPVLLNRDRHRHRRILPSTGYGFARKANSVFVAGVEFNEACKEYAIVFTRTAAGAVSPVVVLGLRNHENLYVDAQGLWGAGYLPAFVRRYPFVLAQLPGQQMGVCIDEACAGVSDCRGASQDDGHQDSQGEPLFDASGANTPFLQSALDFLQRYQQEYLRTDAFCRRLEQCGLLSEMSARADLVDGRSFTVNGLLVVDEKKLACLPDEQALALWRSGELHLISMHLVSLSNLRKLVERMAPGTTQVPAPRP